MLRIGATCLGVNMVQMLLQGEGYLCIDSRCERQCSAGSATNTKECRPLVEAERALDDLCTVYFRRARASHICLPADASTTAVQDYIRILTPTSSFGSTESCQDAIATLACFKVALACDPATDIELPLCENACDVYRIECNIPKGAQDACSSDGDRLAPKGLPCSGATGFNSQSRAKRRVIIALVTLFSIMLLLFVLLWLYCARATRDLLWCFHRRRWRRAELPAIAEAERGALSGPADSTAYNTNGQRYNSSGSSPAGTSAAALRAAEEGAAEQSSRPQGGLLAALAATLPWPLRRRRRTQTTAPLLPSTTAPPRGSTVRLPLLNVECRCSLSLFSSSRVCSMYP